MQQIVSITSKNQVTIPSTIVKLLNISKGDKLLIKTDSQKIIIEKPLKLLNEIAGMVKIPTKYKNKSLSFIIKEAKKEYFSFKK